MRYLPRALLAGGLGLTAAFVAACGGSSGLLSGTQSNALITELNRASAAVSNNDCGSASGAISNLQNQVAGLPASVNTTLVSDLNRGLNTVSALASKQCGAAGTRSTTNAPTHTTTTTQQTTSTATVTTPTEPKTTSTATQTTPATPTSPATTPTSTGTTPTGGGGAGLTGGGADAGPGPGQGNGNGQGD